MNTAKIDRQTIILTRRDETMSNTFIFLLWLATIVVMVGDPNKPERAVQWVAMALTIAAFFVAIYFDFS